ncbi:hypothetical protein ACFOYU_11200 [Microvirga sp. GCM10011540]|uniref:hypothetical protein n=1 Tax=Microvirga sp. GCM10011540 TaxID=3317338 RepID=UPI0036147FD1
MARQDFTFDGTSDILWRDAFTGEVGYWDISAGIYPSWNSFGFVDNSWKIVDTGNYVNGDFGGGSDDVLWRNFSTGEVGYWDVINGDAVAYVGLGSVSLDWQVASNSGSFDFTGDGEDDVLWRNLNTGEVYTWDMESGYVAAAGSQGFVELSWNIITTDDFTGNGTDDILWRNSQTGEIGYWTNGPDYVSLGLVSNSWQVASTGDFSADGSSDFLWRNLDTGEVYIWDLEGGFVASAGSLGFVDLSWEIQGTGDYTGDGAEDVLWRDSGTGEVGYWEMDQGGAFSFVSFGAVSNEWMIA